MFSQSRRDFRAASASSALVGGPRKHGRIVSHQPERQLRTVPTIEFTLCTTDAHAFENAVRTELPENPEPSGFEVTPPEGGRLDVVDFPVLSAVPATSVVLGFWFDSETSEIMV